MEATQEAQIQLKHWSEYWCLPLNPSKCETSFFSVDPTKLTSSPTSSHSTPAFVSIPLPTFLWITFNCTLSFSKYVSLLKVKFSLISRPYAVSLLPRGPLSLLYKAFLGLLLTYASAGCFPFLNVTSITKLERLHRAASCAICGCLLSSLSQFFSLRLLYLPYESP